jgi:hypothetical protein
LEDQEILKGIFNDQIERFGSAEDRAEAEQFAETMVNIYHRDERKYEAWKRVAELVKSPSTLTKPDIAAIEKELGPKVSLKLYDFYLPALDEHSVNADPILSETELADLAGSAGASKHEIRELSERNKRAPFP